jgi:hypothetical protein
MIRITAGAASSGPANRVECDTGIRAQISTRKPASMSNPFATLVSPWLHRNMLAIALANKLARIAWAVLARGHAYQPRIAVDAAS